MTEYGFDWKRPDALGRESGILPIFQILDTDEPVTEFPQKYLEDHPNYDSD